MRDILSRFDGAPLKGIGLLALAAVIVIAVYLGATGLMRDSDRFTQQLPNTPLPAVIPAPAPTLSPPVVIAGSLLPTMEPAPSGLAEAARRRSGQFGSLTPNFPPPSDSAAAAITPLAGDLPNFGSASTPTPTPTRTPDPTVAPLKPAPLPTATAAPVAPEPIYPELPAAEFLWQSLIGLESLGGYVQDLEIRSLSGNQDFATESNSFKVLSVVENPARQAGSIFVDRERRDSPDGPWRAVESTRVNFLTYDGEEFYRHHPGSSGWIGEDIQNARRFRLCELFQCVDPGAISEARYVSAPEILGEKFFEVSAIVGVRDSTVCPEGMDPRACVVYALFLIRAKDARLDSLYAELGPENRGVQLSLRLSSHGKVYGLSPEGQNGTDAPARIVAIVEGDGSSGVYDIVVAFDRALALREPELIELNAPDYGRLSLRGVSLDNRALVFDASSLDRSPADCDESDQSGEYVVDRLVFQDGADIENAVDLFAPALVRYCAKEEDVIGPDLTKLIDPSEVPTPAATAAPTATPVPLVIEMEQDGRRDERVLRFTERMVEFVGPADYHYSYDPDSFRGLSNRSLPEALGRYLSGDEPPVSMAALAPIDGMPYMAIAFLDSRLPGETMESFSHRQFKAQTESSASNMTNLSISTVSNRQGYPCLQYRYDTRWRHPEYMAFCGREDDVVQFIMGVGSSDHESERLFAETLGAIRFLEGSDDG